MHLNLNNSSYYNKTYSACELLLVAAPSERERVNVKQRETRTKKIQTICRVGAKQENVPTAAQRART